MPAGQRTTEVLRELQVRLVEQDGGRVPPEMVPSADQPPPAGTRSRWRTRRAVPVLAGGLALVLGALSLVGLRVTGVWGPSPDPTPEATGDAGTPAPPSPFAGTPADGFAEGAAGIVLPPAEPVGDFTAAEVAAALEQVRQALVAARLDRTMLVDHDVEPFITLMSPAEEPRLREAFDSAGFSAFASQAAGGVVPVSGEPRVAGEISYRATTGVHDIRFLEVSTRLVWVYAFKAAGAEQTADIVVIRDELVWQVPHSDDVLGPGLGLLLIDAESHAWGVDCDAYGRGLIRPRSSIDLDEDLGVAFDPEQALPSGNGC